MPPSITTEHTLATRARFCSTTTRSAVRLKKQGFPSFPVLEIKWGESRTKVLGFCFDNKAFVFCFSLIPAISLLTCTWIAKILFTINLKRLEFKFLLRSCHLYSQAAVPYCISVGGNQVTE